MYSLCLRQKGSLDSKQCCLHNGPANCCTIAQFSPKPFSSALVQVRHAAAQVTSNFYFAVVVNKQVGQGLRNNTSQVSQHSLVPVISLSLFLSPLRVANPCSHSQHSIERRGRRELENLHTENVAGQGTRLGQAVCPAREYNSLGPGTSFFPFFFLDNACPLLRPDFQPGLQCCNLSWKIRCKRKRGALKR